MLQGDYKKKATRLNIYNTFSSKVVLRQTVSH